MRRIKITLVKPGGHAESIGLKNGDVLDTLSGIALENPETLTRGLAESDGRPRELVVYRDGEHILFSVTSTTLGVVLAVFDMDDLLSEQEMANRIAGIIVTTAPTIDGHRVTETIDVLSAECVIGVNVFKEFLASVTDTFGGRSETVQKVLRDARKDCLRELRLEAARIGANAVIAVALDYNEFSGQGKSMLFVVASGTAVIVEPTELLVRNTNG